MPGHDTAPEVRKDVGRLTFALCFAVAFIDGFGTLIMLMTGLRSPRGEPA